MTMASPSGKKELVAMVMPSPLLEKGETVIMTISSPLLEKERVTIAIASPS